MAARLPALIEQAGIPSDDRTSPLLEQAFMEAVRGLFHRRQRQVERLGGSSGDDSGDSADIVDPGLMSATTSTADSSENPSGGIPQHEDTGITVENGGDEVDWVTWVIEGDYHARN